MSASHDEQDSIPSTVPRFGFNNPSFTSSTVPSFLVRTEMANPSLPPHLPSAPTADVVDDGTAPTDNDARSVASDVSSIFHGATDERSTLVRGHRRNLAAAMRIFVDTWTAAKAPHLDADAAFDMAQLADERRRSLLSGIWQFVDVVHSVYPTNDGGDASARVLVANYMLRFENDIASRPYVDASLAENPVFRIAFPTAAQITTLKAGEKRKTPIDASRDETLAGKLLRTTAPHAAPRAAGGHRS